jgi:hypothetical protein
MEGQPQHRSLAAVSRSRTDAAVIRTVSSRPMASTARCCFPVDLLPGVAAAVVANDYIRVFIDWIR